MGVDHIGVLVGEGSFPREQTIEKAREIFRAIPTGSKASALSLSHDVDLIVRLTAALLPDSIALARSYDGVADWLLLDSYEAGDRQIGALGVTHSWELDRRIIESVRIPAIIAEGLGPENVREAIPSAPPAGVDSKTKTDKSDGSHTKDLQKVSAFVAAAITQSREKCLLGRRAPVDTAP
jgi:phosphoribosylanthranilate isomerase